MSQVDKVRSVLADQLGMDIGEFTFDATLRDDLNMDSLDLVEVVMAIEQEFGIVVNDPEAERWKTVEDVVKFVDRRIQR